MALRGRLLPNSVEVGPETPMAAKYLSKVVAHASIAPCWHVLYESPPLVAASVLKFQYPSILSLSMLILRIPSGWVGALNALLIT